MKKPVVVITLGDPAGIGPEIILKAFHKITSICQPIVIGAINLLSKVKKQIRLDKIELKKIDDIFSEELPRAILPVIDLNNINLNNLKIGQKQALSGKVSLEYIQKAVEIMLQKKASALVTAPVCKEAIRMAGIDFVGHTEFIANITHSKKVAMVMVAKDYKLLLLTRHIPISEVSQNISTKLIIESVLLSYEWLKKYFSIRHPRIGICNLNPHADKDNFLGKEEKNIILPAINILQQKGIHIEGPLPIEHIFRKMCAKLLDLAICHYHDQAMVPLRLLFGFNIINTTIGLPFIRTSPGHGVGYDIAGKNKANPEGIISAISFAVKLAKATYA